MIDQDGLQLLDYDALLPRFQSTGGQDPAFKRRWMRYVDETLLCAQSHCEMFTSGYPVPSHGSRLTEDPNKLLTREQ